MPLKKKGSQDEQSNHEKANSSHETLYFTPNSCVSSQNSSVVDPPDAFESIRSQINGSLTKNPSTSSSSTSQSQQETLASSSTSQDNSQETHSDSDDSFILQTSVQPTQDTYEILNDFEYTSAQIQNEISNTSTFDLLDELLANEGIHSYKQKNLCLQSNGESIETSSSLSEANNADSSQKTITNEELDAKIQLNFPSVCEIEYTCSLPNRNNNNNLTFFRNTQ